MDSSAITIDDFGPLPVRRPATVAELVLLPAFDGNTLVCPVGSENSADWKPALAYRLFREALLAAKAKAPAPTERCAACGHANPADSHFCNSCGKKIGASPAAAPPMAQRSEPEPRRLEPEPPVPAAQPDPEPTPEPAPIEPELPPIVPIAAPSPAATGSSKVLWLLILSVLAVAGGAYAYWTLVMHGDLRQVLKSATQATPAAVSTSTPSVPLDTVTVAVPLTVAPPTPAPEPAVTPKTAPAAPPPQPEKSLPLSPSRKGKRRAKKPMPIPAPAKLGAAALIDSVTKETPSEETSNPAPAADGGFMLPGVPRRAPAKSGLTPKIDAVIPEPPKSADSTTPPSTTVSEGPKVEDGTTRQVHEQFDFCVQLLAQGAYEDHFETCLCADARQAAPYRGRKSVYATALKKRSSAGKLETHAVVGSINVNETNASVVADWKSSAFAKPRKVTENWRLEDGLWCQRP